MREFLKSLELDKEIVESIMVEHGKLITEAKGKTQELQDKVTDYEAKIEELTNSSKNTEEISQELEALKKQVAEEKAQKELAEKDEIMTRNIMEAIGEKQFVNDYTKNAIISEIKTALGNSENAGKSAKDLFNDITKDTDGLFVNPNQLQDMAGIGDTEVSNETKEMPTIW